MYFPWILYLTSEGKIVEGTTLSHWTFDYLALTVGKTELLTLTNQQYLILYFIIQPNTMEETKNHLSTDGMPDDPQMFAKEQISE